MELSGYKWCWRADSSLRIGSHVGCDAGNVARRLVSSYMLPRRGTALGICLIAATGRQDCVQIFAIIIDDQVVAAPETAVVGTTARACLTRRANGLAWPAAVTRKGAP